MCSGSSPRLCRAPDKPKTRKAASDSRGGLVLTQGALQTGQIGAVLGGQADELPHIEINGNVLFAVALGRPAILRAIHGTVGAGNMELRFADLGVGAGIKKFPNHIVG